MSIEQKCPACGALRLVEPTRRSARLADPSADLDANTVRSGTVFSASSTQTHRAGSLPWDAFPTGGQVFGNYELIEEIAHGGMGVVFKARQLGLDRIVALKMVLSERLASEVDIRRFLVEAQAAAKLQHPNIVAIHEVGQVEGQHFYSMDFVAGQTLAQVIREHPLPARRAAAYVEKISRAIHYAHTEGVLHRDLKPGNVIIDYNDEPRVTDFGLAKLLHGDSQQTLSGTILGTPSYMSLEQATGQTDKIDVRSDVYSMGAVLYELLTGSPPFRGETTLATLKLLAETEAVPPRSINPKIPADLETICLKALEKQLSRRYSDAAAFAEDLRRFLHYEPISARPIGFSGKLFRWCARKPALAAVGLIATVLLLTVLIGSPIAAYMLNEAKEVAERRRALAESSLERARRSAYVADMSLVQEAVDRGQMSYALQLLRQHIPASGVTDLRHWEWRYYWELCQAQDMTALTRHHEEIYFCAVSPTGRWVGSESSEGTVKLWNTSANREVLSIEKKGATGPQFSEGEVFFAVPMPDGTIRLWNLADLTELSPIRHPGAVQDIGFRGDSELITFAGGMIRYWDIASGALLREVEAIGGRRVAHTPDWKTILAWGGQNEITLWREGQGVIWTRNSGHATSIREPALALSPNGNWIGIGLSIVGGGGWTVKILDAATGHPVIVFPNQRVSAIITSVTFSPDGELFAAASEDQTVRLWDTSEWEVRPPLTGHRVSLVSFLPGNNQAVTAGTDGYVRLWKLDAGRGQAARLEIPQKFLTELVSIRRGGFTPDSALFAAVAPDGEGVVVDPQLPKLVRQFAVPFKNSTRAAVGPKAVVVAIGRQNGIVTLWNTVENRSLGDLELAKEQPVTAVAISPDGNRVAAANGNGAFCLWDAGTATELEGWRNLPKLARTIRFSPDGKLLACGQSDGAISLWEVSTSRKIRVLTGHSKGILLLGFSENSARLASTSYDHTASVWDVESGTLVATFSGATDVFFHPELSPDGTRLFLSEWQNSSLFDVQSQRCVARLLTGFPRFLDPDTVFGLAPNHIWHWKPPALREIAAREWPQVSNGR